MLRDRLHEVFFHPPIQIGASYAHNLGRESQVRKSARLAPKANGSGFNREDGRRLLVGEQVRCSNDGISRHAANLSFHHTPILGYRFATDSNTIGYR
jgi:hypothetical protein